MAGTGRTPSAQAASGELKHSSNGLEREQVSDIQRARMLAAMAEVACERGAGNVTVAHIVARSGVSRRTFYEQFADREECLRAAFDTAVERIAARVVPAYERHQRWRDRIRASLQALLQFLDDEPYQGCLAIVQALGAGQAALERRQRVLAQVIAAVDRGRGESKHGGEVPPLTAEGVVGAVLSVIHARLLEEQRPPLVGLTNELMSMIALPYLGPAAARRELARRPVPRERRSANAGLGSLRDLEMRLTYRTMRVLLAIGSHPGASNRQVADASDIHDQGQVSKLLRRLEDLGLIRNADEPRVKGEANAWTLTERGATVREAISEQTSRS
jgi:AcrR family transcriptional regulator/DNA-binding MarR family transcriptional regulator